MNLDYIQELLFQTCFKFFGYSVSYLELIGTITGLLSVWFSAKYNLLTWPTGLINVICFFFIFWAAGLYSDMFLQIYFFAVNVYGWIFWKKTEDKIEKVFTLLPKQLILLSSLICISTVIFAFVVTNLHVWYPSAFPKPASFPILDSLIAMMSVCAMWLMARKYLEAWALWILVDIIATIIYFQKEIYFVSLLYFVFLIIAIVGFKHWKSLSKYA